MKTGPRVNICRSVCFAQIGWRVGKRRTISNLGRENLPYYLNCFALFGWKTGSGWYRPSLQSRSARGTGLRFALFHSMAESGRYTPISWSVCFAQIGWRVGKRRIHTELGREKKPYWMFVSPRSAGAWVKGEFTPYLAARRSLTNELFRLFWLESGIWMLQIKFSSASPARTSYPSLPNQLTPRTQLPTRAGFPGLPNQLTPRLQLPRPNRLPWLTPHKASPTELPCTTLH